MTADTLFTELELARIRHVARPNLTATAFSGDVRLKSI